MKKQGYSKIYHLHGGILKYLEDIPEERSLYQGSCFVFDRRTSINHGLGKGEHVYCFNCRHPLTSAEISYESYLKGIQCLYCADICTEKQREAAAQRQRQMELAEIRQQKHLGMKHPHKKASSDECI